MSYTSPLNSNIKISAKVTRTYYELHRDKKFAEFKYDTEDIGCDENEWFQILTDGESYILITEKKDN